MLAQNWDPVVDAFAISRVRTLEMLDYGGAGAISKPLLLKLQLQTINTLI